MGRGGGGGAVGDDGVEGLQMAGRFERYGWVGCGAARDDVAGT